VCDVTDGGRFVDGYRKRIVGWISRKMNDGITEW